MRLTDLSRRFRGHCVTTCEKLSRKKSMSGNGSTPVLSNRCCETCTSLKQASRVSVAAAIPHPATPRWESAQRLAPEGDIFDTNEFARSWMSQRQDGDVTPSRIPVCGPNHWDESRSRWHLGERRIL